MLLLAIGYVFLLADNLLVCNRIAGAPPARSAFPGTNNTDNATKTARQIMLTVKMSYFP
jgi:hypothetical protein